MNTLFAYGSLMCEDIMLEVSGCCPQPLPATLLGYSRKPVRNALYPGLIPENRGRVEGVIYRDLPASAWAKLDRFEGEMYARQSVSVRLRDGSSLLAATYLVRASFRNCLEASEWDFASFLRNGKQRFRRGYQGYQKL